jgi:antibiotic biosynthesis monooxygenase (ABM) superfamily enzyme
MAIVTYLAIAPTIMLFNLVFGGFLTAIPQHLTIFITAPFIVILMTRVVMPLMTKVFKGYLYPQPPQNEKN